MDSPHIGHSISSGTSGRESGVVDFDLEDCEGDSCSLGPRICRDPGIFTPFLSDLGDFVADV
jgi:hypothetical protein